MAFGYNDLIWILSIIAWTIGVTAIIMYIIKRRRRRTTTGTS
jgi:predicted membrane channel-forming protein YqfA (hemolysin III family)